MFKDIAEYMKLSLKQRQQHLKLEENCIEIGGYDSREFRGLLAHFLKTTIPTKKEAILCHACHNHWCSNPRHFYWGTHGENEIDAFKNGKKNAWESTIEKYGKEKAREIASSNASKAGKIGGGSNKMSDYEIEIRKNDIIACDITKFGWVGRAAKKLSISHTHVRRFVNEHLREEINEAGKMIFTRKSPIQ